jgi:transposase
VEIFRGQPRRRWSEEEKSRLVAETLMPGETVRAVARRHGVNTSQLFTWRKRFRAQIDLPAAAMPAPGFAAVAVETATPGAASWAGEAASEAKAPVPAGLIEIELPRGGRVRIAGRVAPAVVTAAVRALVRR